MTHVEWGATGALAVAERADVVVVVDVLSFTTTVSVALARGITVLPFGWKDARARAYAEERDAVLAVGRFESRDVEEPRPSLSPAAMAEVSGVQRVVLPSPNGSTICTLLAERGVEVVTASLRNRRAVARWLGARREGSRLALVAAGERWPDATLRPAVEDLWGAGAVLAALTDLGTPATVPTPEARFAEHAFRAVAEDLAAELAGCTSGRELVDAGFGADVAAAAALDADDVVPVLSGGELSPAG